MSNLKLGITTPLGRVAEAKVAAPEEALAIIILIVVPGVTLGLK
jgi:hypothetical protein